MDFEQFKRAIALRDSGREKEALCEFEELATLETEVRGWGSLIHNQAVCLWRLGNLKEARDRLLEAERLWANQYTEAMDARLCVAEGNDGEALRKLAVFFERYRNLRQSDDEAFYADTFDALGFLLFKLERYAEAIEPFEASLARSDTNDNTTQRRLYLGICRLQIGDLEVAERELTKSLPSDFRHLSWAEAQYQLGRLYIQRGDYRGARQAFELAECFEKNKQRMLDVSKWLIMSRAKLGEQETRSS